jgi:transposase-like protein
MVWRCNGCRRQFSVKVGTIFEDSPLPFSKWLPAMWLIVNAKNGISSCELARALGVTQKSAWHMLHRIRLAMQSGSFFKLGGHVEADETYIGAAARNMHKHIREAKIGKGTGPKGKTIVMGTLERGKEIRLQVVPHPTKPVLHSHVLAHVVKGSNIYTDASRSYDGLDAWYAHQVVDHAETYVDGAVHTNGLENFWSLLKRTMRGTYVSVEPFHLFRYLDEYAFRFNMRQGNDLSRFEVAIQQVLGKRLTYNELTGKVLAAGA